LKKELENPGSPCGPVAPLTPDVPDVPEVPEVPDIPVTVPVKFTVVLETCMGSGLPKPSVIVWSVPVSPVAPILRTPS
jgi:hypothetical protein